MRQPLLLALLAVVTAFPAFAAKHPPGTQVPVKAASAAPGKEAAAPGFSSLAREALLLDYTTGTVLYEKNADQLMTPSSMSKLMTLYVVFDRLKNKAFTMEDSFSVSETAWRTGGSKMFVEVGNRIKVSDLVNGVAVQSGNDACVVLAEGISGSEAEFAHEMNRMAKQIGLQHSHFVNSTGLPDPEHKMTARDLAVLGARIITDFPEYYPLLSQPEFTYHGIRQYNRNPLLNKDHGVDGMKTGHTEEAGYGIVISAMQDNHRLILVMNGLASMKERATEAERMVRYGFREFTMKTPFRKGDQVGDAPVWMGTALHVPLVVNQDISVTLPRRMTGEVKMSLEYNAPLQAPVALGQEVGHLLIQFDNAAPQVLPVVAGAEVPELTGLSRLWPAIKYFLFVKE